MEGAGAVDGARALLSNERLWRKRDAGSLDSAESLPTFGAWFAKA